VSGTARLSQPLTTIALSTIAADISMLLQQSLVVWGTRALSGVAKIV